MRQSDAERVLGILVGATSGWSDDIVDEMLLTVAGWDDVQAAERACARFTRPDGRARPRLAQLIEAYAEEEQRRIPYGSGRLVPFDDGIQIAWRAYVGEAHRLGKQPNRETFGQWAKILRDSSGND
jgi:hypothetical protein